MRDPLIPRTPGYVPEEVQEAREQRRRVLSAEAEREQVEEEEE